MTGNRQGTRQGAGGYGGNHIDFHGGLFTGPVIGTGVQNNHYAAPRPRASLPHQVGVIPPRADSFQYRAEAGRLRETLTGGEAAILVGQDTVRGQVLVGMGGVGKSQLAADYARTIWRAGEVDVLVWITAGNPAAVAAGYAQAAVELLGADPADFETAARAFLAWLEPRAGQHPVRWLVVLDDVTQPGDLNGLWPAPSPHGRTLVTTRRRDAALRGHGRHMIEIGLFTPLESVTYLTTALADHGRTEPDNDLAALADDVGHLPLALSQAVAYLIDADITCAAYRSLLADRATKLADATPEEDALPDGQTHPTAAAWAMSIDRANTLRPAGLARPLLQLAAFLDPNGIPDTVLTSPAALAYLTDHATAAGHDQGPVTPERARMAFRALHRLSLADHTPDAPHQAVRVHQLIQRAVRDTLTPDLHHQTAHTASDALIAAWPDIENDTTVAQALRANTEALTACAETALHSPDAHAVLYQAGLSLGEAGQVTAARDHFHHLTQTTTSHLGSDHPATLTARHNLARWQGAAGDPAKAATAFAALLDDLLRVLEPDHPATLTTRHNLAHWQGEAGSPTSAAGALAELLDDLLRVLGPDHPATLTTRHDLAHWRGSAGDPTGAASAFADVLTDFLRVLGPDHPDTLNTRHNLARWQGAAGDPTGAASAFAELLEDFLRVLGPDHPDTLNTRANLARWQGSAGDPTGAATAYADLLTDRLRVLGPDHPDTLTTRGNLARWQGEAGDPAGAADAYTELLEDFLRVLGPGHPDTLTARGNLARWQGEAGDPTGAADAYTELLEDFLRVLGPEHPNTLTARQNLAYWQGLAGEATGAVTAHAELLEDFLRVLGPDHPDTLTTRANLAYWQGEAGDATKAATAYADLLADFLRVLGPDHPSTLTTRNNLAYWQGAAGDPTGAASAFAELLTDCLRVLGPDHPNTLTTRNNLARWQG
ncbi:tetratricopeptide repeat protein [Streptomyces sp. NPDC059582]|uniref:tetratricopeptide repeat protein n=1 Tax=Streptomyces sp. NPDC059582 TaxID=3346875 RepID=UPI00368DF0F6